MMPRDGPRAVPVWNLLDALPDPGKIDPPIDVHPDQERLAAQVPFRQDAPVSAVLAVVAVVDHHAIVPWLNHPFTFAGVAHRHAGALQPAVPPAGPPLAQLVPPPPS